MSISGISSYDQLYSVYGIQGVDQTQDTSTASQTQATPVQSGKDQASFSAMGQMMSQMAQLQNTDPTKFKATAQQISTDLAQQAQSAGTIQQSQMLSGLSTKFAQAASTGSMDSLKPQHRGSRSSGAQQGGAMSDATSVISQDLSAVVSNAGLSATASNANISANGMPTDPRELMEQLQQLAITNPAKFKELTQKISTDLAAKAQTEAGTPEGQALTDMSQKFAAAAQSGTMDSLKPHHGHHHGHKGSGSEASTSSSSTTTASATSSAQDLMKSLDATLRQDISSALSNAGIGANSSAGLGGTSMGGQDFQTLLSNLGSGATTASS